MKRIVANDKYRVAEWAGARIESYKIPEKFNAIGLECDGVLVAAAVYDSWYHPSISGHIASDGSRRWANREFLRAIFDYPFRQIGCARITAPIADGNEAARRFVEKLGFVLEGRLRRAMPDGGDRLLYGLLKEDCKWV